MVGVIEAGRVWIWRNTLEMGLALAHYRELEATSNMKTREQLRPYPEVAQAGLSDEKYDVVIIGGGLGGLSLSIQLAKAGFLVGVFEKEQYPFHKVCGEYISFESWNFLQELGIPLSDWNLPTIRRLMVSSPNGKYLEHDLPLGGFGISRYKLDAALADIVKKCG